MCKCVSVRVSVRERVCWMDGCGVSVWACTRWRAKDFGESPPYAEIIVDEDVLDIGLFF